MWFFEERLRIFPGCFAPAAWFTHFPAVFHTGGAFHITGVQVTGGVVWPTRVSNPLG
jgi:hypothetical protein